ncbi:MAG: hypothetical protein JAZ02_06210 [Candidatus Thiodiazotropha endolucinida]|nr:hypothetical protein [Candidatus Thiodiazotropha endolucinida]
MDYRVILYHKQATSARTRFLKFSHDSVCAFKTIPKLAQITDGLAVDTVIHPAAVLKRVEEKLGLEAGILKVEADYQHSVEVPGESIQIILANITTMDPPFELAEEVGAQFICRSQYLI